MKPLHSHRSDNTLNNDNNEFSIPNISDQFKCNRNRREWESLEKLNFEVKKAIEEENSWRNRVRNYDSNYADL